MKREYFKKIMTVMIIAALFSTGCSEKISKEEHFSVIDSMALLERQKIDSLERTYVRTLDDIDENLDQVRDKYGILVLGPKSNFDEGIDKREQIINNISAINDLLEQNKAKITKLERSIVAYKGTKAEFKKSIEKAKVRINEQEQEILALKELLASKDFTIDELNRVISSHSVTISRLLEENKSQKENLERKYFAYGTKKQLKSKKLLITDKNLLRLPRKRELNPNMSNEEFSSINMYTDTKIPIAGTGAKLISSHPNGSYEIQPKENDLTMLIVKDPDAFWKSTNYLVVQVKSKY